MVLFNKTSTTGNVVNYLISKWWVFFIVGVLAGTAGFIYASYKPIKFRSRLTFALDQDEGGMSNAISLAAQFGLNLGSGKDIFAGDNILEILRSRRIVEKVFLSVDTFNNKPYTLIEYFWENFYPKNNRTKDVHFPVGQLKNSFSYLQDSMLFAGYEKFIGGHLSAQRPDRKVSIYEVQITSPEEKYCKVFTERLVQEANNYYVQISSRKTLETLQILEQRVGSMKGNLTSSITERAATQDANVNPAFAMAQVPVLKQQANIQVYSAAYAEMFKNLELARYQYLKQIPLMQIIDAPDYPMMRIKVSRLYTGILYAFLAVLITAMILWYRRNSYINKISVEEI
ncbi:hypothetical protein BH09BAC2_BH09BAC2_02890 [soil metagenome]